MTTGRPGRRARPRAARSVGSVVLAGVVTLSAAGVAQAYLHSEGAGSGSGATGSGSALKLSAASVSDALYPGETATVALTARNPDSADVWVSALSLDTTQGSSGFARASGSTGCGLANFTFTTQTNGGDGWTVPANGSLAISLPDAVAASTSMASACQGVTLTVYLKAS